MTDYERYQLEWMIDHGHSLGELMTELTNLQNDLELTPGVNLTVSDVFEAWEHDHGFGGELYACEDEYNDVEGIEAEPDLKVAVGAGYVFNLFDSKEILNAGIDISNTGTIVTVDGMDYQLKKGVTYEDSRRVDALLDTHGEMRIADHRKTPESDVSLKGEAEAMHDSASQLAIGGISANHDHGR